jgi:phosphopantetheinyl transferase
MRRRITEPGPGADELVVVRVMPASDRWSPFVPERELARLQRRSERATRDEAISCAGALRCMLGRVLGRNPHALLIERSPAGKPWLAGGPGFSIAHTRGFGLIAVAPRQYVGVDVERADRRVDSEALAEFFFPAAERAQILGAPPSGRRRAALEAYTRFEAALKATGAGITVPTDRFSSIARGLCCQYVDVGPAWIACVAASLPSWSVRVVEGEDLLAP